MCLVWWNTLVIPVLSGLRQENHEFEASLGPIVRPCLTQENKRIALKCIFLKIAAATLPVSRPLASSSTDPVFSGP
jgi:hypothetical protein